MGARLALTILSGMEPGEFVQCVQEGNTAALVRLPGVGKKTAERLIIELRDRLEGAATVPAAASDVAPAAAASPVEDAVSALVGLGYKPQDASRMVRAIDSGAMSSEDIIRAALQATVNEALGREVMLADDALTGSSMLVIERWLPGTMEDPVPQGRILEKPVQFQLVRNGDDCFLVRKSDGARYVLSSTNCEVE